MSAISSSKLSHSFKGKRTSDTKIAQAIAPGKLVHHGTLLRIAILFPQFPQPDQLEDLLWEEECADEVWVRREGGKIPVMDIQHVRRRKDAILLRSKVVDEGRGREIAHCRLCVTHVDVCSFASRG
jgi:hypothetical protein